MLPELTTPGAAILTSTALSMSDPDAPTIMLCHQPDLFPAVVQRDIDLTLAGHYHGGQVKLRFLGIEISLAHLVSEFVEGSTSRIALSYMSAVASALLGRRCASMLGQKSPSCTSRDLSRSHGEGQPGAVIAGCPPALGFIP
jgi:hypothetical protein